MGSRKDRFQIRPKTQTTVYEKIFGYEVIDTANNNIIRYENTATLVKEKYSIFDNLEKSTTNTLIKMTKSEEEANETVKQRARQVTYWLNHYEPKTE